MKKEHTQWTTDHEFARWQFRTYWIFFSRVCCHLRVENGEPKVVCGKSDVWQQQNNGDRISWCVLDDEIAARCGVARCHCLMQYDCERNCVFGWQWLWTDRWRNDIRRFRLIQLFYDLLQLTVKWIGLLRKYAQNSFSSFINGMWNLRWDLIHRISNVLCKNIDDFVHCHKKYINSR